MKKLSAFILLIFLFAGGFLIYSWNTNKIIYPTGRDTYEVFGNGRFQICYDNGTACIADGEKEVMIEDDIYRYRKHEDNIFIVGQCGYTVVNINSGEVIQKENISDLSEEYVNIFNDVDSFKIFKNK